MGTVMASRSLLSRMSLTLVGVATVTKPAPLRSAAFAASAAAPVLPTEPAMIPACPNVPLWADRGRAGSKRRHSPNVNSEMVLSTASPKERGIPMSAIWIVPAWSMPGPR
jgi:hypothetical protein